MIAARSRNPIADSEEHGGGDNQEPLSDKRDKRGFVSPCELDTCPGFDVEFEDAMMLREFPAAPRRCTAEIQLSSLRL
jgi:hypothetical protein